MEKLDTRCDSVRNVVTGKKNVEKQMNVMYSSSFACMYIIR